MLEQQAAAGWYTDPGAGSQLRYWDGGRWTEHLAPMQRRQVAYATPGSRFAAFLIDQLLVFAASTIVILPLGFALMVFVGVSVGEDQPSIGTILFALLVVLVVLVVTVVSFVIAALPIVAEGRLGQTYGKHMLRIEVVKEDSGRFIGGWPALGRAIVKGLGLQVLFLGVLWILWDERRRGWHDMALSSIVVEAPQTGVTDPFSFYRRSLQRDVSA